MAIPKGCVNHSWSMVSLFTAWHRGNVAAKRKRKKKVYPGALTLDQFAELCVDTVIKRHRIGKAKREAREDDALTMENNRKFARKGE
jgi:hypothetical protein